uniref:Uncharacterized protein n=1 Tax=Salix viminalis TaxID=40686 RepID=A0A6N2L0P2_SALVM
MCTFNWRFGKEELLKILCRRVEEIAPPCGRNCAAEILIFDLGLGEIGNRLGGKIVRLGVWDWEREEERERKEELVFIQYYQADLLGFPGIAVFACGLLDHMIKRVIYTYLDCDVKLIVFGVGFSSTRTENIPTPPNDELKLQMQATTKTMERMNFVMGNVCDGLARVEKHGNEAHTSKHDARIVWVEPKSNNGSMAERPRWAFEEDVDDIDDGGFKDETIGHREGFRQHRNRRDFKNKTRGQFSQRVHFCHFMGHEDKTEIAVIQANVIEKGELKDIIHMETKKRFTIVRDGKTITLVPLSPKLVYDDKLKLKMECEDGKSENNTRKLPMILLVYKKNYLNTNNVDFVVPNVAVSLLLEYNDVFPGDILSGLPLIRSIEHQIDLVLGASIPNRQAYRSNPKETKELQRQVNELMMKGYIHESMSPCAVTVLLVPQKDGT